MSRRLKEDDHEEKKFTLKASDDRNIGRKVIVHNPTFEMVKVMVKNAIKQIRSPCGASIKDISKYLEENYAIFMKDLKSCIRDVLKEGVNNGVFEEKDEAFFLKKENSKEKNFAKGKKKLEEEEEKEDVVKTTKDILFGRAKALEEAEAYFLKKENAKRNNFAKEKDKLEEEDVKFAKHILYQRDKALEDDTMHESINPEKTEEIPFPTREMLIMMIKYSIKNFEYHYGASLDDINLILEDKYKVNTIFFRHCIEQILKESVDIGVLDKVRGADPVERYKIKEPKSVVKGTQNLLRKV